MSQNQPHVPVPSEAHEAYAQLIDHLGGPTKVAALIEKRLGHKFTPQAISMWKKRGIPYRYRGALALEARSKEVKLPPDFFGIRPPPPEGDLPAQPQTAA